MRTIPYLAAVAIGLAATSPAWCTPVGDTFELELNGWYNSVFGGWIWGNPDDNIGSPPPQGLNFDNAGGVVGTFTFGTPGVFSFLGNTLVVDSYVTDTGPNTETWTISISAQDGGLLFNPEDGVYDEGTGAGFFRAWHLREIAVGGAGQDDGAGTFVWNRGDMIESPTFVDFANEVGLQAWTNDSSVATFLSDGAPAESGQVDFVSFGDLDFDGLVNLADYQVWKDNFGETVSAPFADGDANGDEIVDVADYTLWRDNLGVDTRFLKDGQDDLFARAETPFGATGDEIGVLLNRQFGNPGLIVYDDGIFQAQNPMITEIELTVDVITTGPGAVSVTPEPSSAFGLLTLMSLLFAGGRCNLLRITSRNLRKAA